VYTDSAAGPRQPPRAADTPDVLERIGDPRDSDPTIPDRVCKSTKHEDP